jgi:hypothetical protein
LALTGASRSIFGDFKMTRSNINSAGGQPAQQDMRDEAVRFAVRVHQESAGNGRMVDYCKVVSQLGNPLNFD